MSAKAGFSPLVTQIVDALGEGSHDLKNIYLVGGAVRDTFLGKPSHDLDFVVSGDSLAIARNVANALGGAYFTLDETYQVGRVVLSGAEMRHQVLDFVKLQGETLEDDLRSRDFTINAIAVPLAELNGLIDPLGGVADLLKRRLVPCSDRSLLDDPVRALRAVRMSAKYQLVISPETRRLIAEAVPQMSKVSAERLRDEFLKTLEAPKPAASLRVLDRLGALEMLFPEIAALKDVTQGPPHLYDLWEHTLHTVLGLEGILQLLDVNYLHDNEGGGDLFSGLISHKLGRYRGQISSHLSAGLVPERSARGMIFLSALLHDIAKPQHRMMDDNGQIGFSGHEASGAKVAARIGAAMKLSNAEIQRLTRTIADHARPWQLASIEKPPSKRAIYRFWRDNREAGIDICLLELADLRGVYGHTLPKAILENHLDTARRLLEAYFENPELVSPRALLDGNDLISRFGIEPGPIIGDLLNELIEAQVEGDVTTEEQAADYVRAYLSAKNLD